jgi:hypothetical protein
MQINSGVCVTRIVPSQPGVEREDGNGTGGDSLKDIGAAVASVRFLWSSLTSVRVGL